MVKIDTNGSILKRGMLALMYKKGSIYREVSDVLDRSIVTMLVGKVKME